MDTQKHILVLEDNAPLAKAITFKLTQRGFSVRSAGSVDQAIRFLDEGYMPNAIWLDHYVLGEKSGMDFVRHLKSSAPLNSVPVMLVSNTVSDDKIGEYLKMGVAKYFVKSDHNLDEMVDYLEELTAQK